MEKKKKYAVISSVAVTLFIAPLIVFAAKYTSEIKTNPFRPADANVQIEENIPAEMQTETYFFPEETDTNGNYSVDKTVSIGETRNPNDEYLRIRFVLTWYDTDGNVCAGLDRDIADFTTIELDNQNAAYATKLFFKNSTGTIIVTLHLTESWNDHWSYVDNGCFESKSPVNLSAGKRELLKKVEISPAVYNAAKAAELELHVDVLADAIQTVKEENDDVSESM